MESSGNPNLIYFKKKTNCNTVYGLIKQVNKTGNKNKPQQIPEDYLLLDINSLIFEAIT